jgi:hypothetical protein
VLIVVGAGLPGSPFTSKLAGSWFFGIPTAGQHPSEWLSLLLVYGGTVVLVAAWFALVAHAAALPHLTAILALWCAPLLIAPPLLSRDVYTYAASGRLAAAGLNPYRHGLTALPHSVFFPLADPLWRHAHAPYGPLFFDLARINAHLMGTDVVAALEGYRFLALLGLALMAASVPVLARAYGGHPSPAFTLAVLNPLVLLYLIGGMHNDALMLGLLMAGLALAARRHPVLGVLLCALAAEVKVPAALGIVFIGWMWAGQDASLRLRLRFLAQAAALGALALVVVSELSGFGWGWLVDLSTPGTVVSWLDPATALGLAAAHGLHGVGISVSTHSAVVAARAGALLLAGLLTLALLLRVDRIGLPRAIGWSLLSVALLGPIVWPWYETWGLAFLALASDRWSRRAVLALSTLACFATVPAHVDISTGATVVIALALAALGVVAVAVGTGRVGWRAFTGHDEG